MSRKFAFGVSLVDLIRKLSYRYPYPVDYVDNFASQAYHSGADVDIVSNEHELGFASSSSIDDAFFAEAGKKSVVSLAAIIPPVKDFGEVTLESGEYRLRVDAQRNVVVEKTAPVKGTRLVIKREAEPENVESEIQRLSKLYADSDINLRINGTEAGNTVPFGFEFEYEGIKGRISYNRASQGGLHFFKKGRYVSSEDFISGIDVFIYEHNLTPTITNSKVITKGRGRAEFERIKSQIPQLILDYLESPQMQQLRESSEASYQTVLRTFLRANPKNGQIRGHVRSNILFSDSKGNVQDQFDFYYASSHFEGLPYSEQEVYRLLAGERNPEKRSQRRRGTLKGVAAASLAGLALGYLLYCASPRAESPLIPCSPTGDVSTAGAIAINYTCDTDGEHLGADFLTREELISLLKSKPGDGTTPRGYLRVDSSNVLIERDGRIFWSDQFPEDELRVAGAYVDIPPEIQNKVAHNPTFKNKLRAVHKYIERNFEYDSIDPSEMQNYSDILSAIVGEKKAICGGANSYAATLLYELGVRDIRAATGYLNGGPHLWLEANFGTKEKPKWVVYDYTPKKINSELSTDLPPETSFGISNGGLAALLQNKAPAEHGLGNDLSALLSNPVGYIQAGGIQLVGLSMLILGATGAYGLTTAVTSRRRRRRHLPETGNLDESSEQYAQECLLVRDILGIGGVVSTAEEDFAYNNGTLSVPQTYFEAKTPLQTALDAVNYLPLGAKQKLRMYESVVSASTK